jgi:hypothetical protein
MKTTDSDALARLLDGDSAAADDASAELRALASLAQAMEARAAAPRPDFRDALRESLLAEAAKPVPPTLLERARMAYDDKVARVKYSARAAAATTAAAMTLSTGGVAVAATQSVPGDLLYPMKIAVEDARLSRADDAVSRGELLLSATSSRIDEAERAAGHERHPDATEALTSADASLRAGAGELIGAYQDTGDRSTLGLLEALRDDTAAQLAALAPLLDADGARALADLETTFSRITDRIAAVTGECCVGAEGDPSPGIPQRGGAFDFGRIPPADEPFDACPCPAPSTPVLPEDVLPDPVPTATPDPVATEPVDPAPSPSPGDPAPQPTDPPQDEPTGPLPVDTPLDPVIDEVDDTLDPVRDAIDDVIDASPDPVRDAIEDVIGGSTSPLRDALDSATEPLPLQPPRILP